MYSAHSEKEQRVWLGWAEVYCVSSEGVIWSCMGPVSIDRPVILWKEGGRPRCGGMGGSGFRTSRRMGKERRRQRKLCLFPGMLGSWALDQNEGGAGMVRTDGTLDSTRTAVLVGGVFHRTGTL